MAAEEPQQDPRRDPRRESLRQKLGDRFADFEADPRPDLRAGILASAARPVATAGQWQVLGFLLGLLLISMQLDAPLSPPRTPVRSGNLPASRVIRQESGAAGSAPSLARQQQPEPALIERQPIQLPVDQQRRLTPVAAGYSAPKQESTVVAARLVTGTDQRFPARNRPSSKRLTLPLTDQPTGQETDADDVTARLVTPQVVLNASSESIPVDPSSPTGSVAGEVQPLSIRPLSGLPGTGLLPLALVPPVQLHQVQQSLSGRVKRWHLSVGVAPLLTYQEVLIPNTVGQVLIVRNRVGAFAGERLGYQAFIQVEKQLRPQVAIAGSVLYTHLQLSGQYAQWNGRYQVNYSQGNVPAPAPELLAIATDNRFDALAFRAELVYSLRMKKPLFIRTGAEYQHGLRQPGQTPFVVIGAGSWHRVLGHRIALESTFRYALRPQSGLADTTSLQIRPYSFGLTIRVPLN